LITLFRDLLSATHTTCCKQL